MLCLLLLFLVIVLIIVRYIIPCTVVDAAFWVWRETKGLENTEHYWQGELLELGPQITFTSSFFDKLEKLNTLNEVRLT